MNEIRERPRCRRVIERLGLSPVFGKHCSIPFALDAQGQERDVSDGLKTQMRKMVAEGRWEGRGSS